VPRLGGVLEITDLEGKTILVTDSRDHPPNALHAFTLGESVLRIIVPARSLSPGEYRVNARFSGDSGFSVNSPGTLGILRLKDRRTLRGDQRGRYFSTLLDWEIEPRSQEPS